MIADRRLWLTADRDRVVEDGDPAAAFLFATPGKEISAQDVKRFGLAKAEKPEPVAEPTPEVSEPEVEEKQAAPAEDKQADAPANKARKARKFTKKA